MIWPIYLLYCICVGLIRVYKWVELQILKLFKPILKRNGKQLCESIGIVLHCPGDKEWTQADNERVLSKCSEKYETLVHLKVNDPMFFVRVANTGTLGLGEAYLAKMWNFTESEEDITEFAKRILENNMVDLYYNWWNKFLEWLEFCAFNLQTRKRAFQVGIEHYDLSNKLFELMLDPWMQYSCGYWKDAKDLNTAQLNKLELIAKKLDLKPGMRVLDIGCGWGTLCKYLAENYKVECVGVTISKEGVAYGMELCKGLPVDIRLQDYRAVTGKFDRIVSIGMLEHVGFQNYREYFTTARKCLADDGIFLCHTIAKNHLHFPQRTEPFISKYIFPNGILPNPVDIAKATQGLFVIEDWHNFGPDYAKTLNSWRENFLKGWPQIQGQHSEKFYRMWLYYLSVCRSVFSSRRFQLWQIVLSKDGLKREYRAAR